MIYGFSKICNNQSGRESLHIATKAVIDKIEVDGPSEGFINEGSLPRLWDWTLVDDWTEDLEIAEIAVAIIKYNCIRQDIAQLLK
ncbi:hypothetical protein LCGC14_0744660 [marine sediment metagenome]|uniref:Uncharacterized protein n=1 Tax=marine sediment metagenome TaxID=412755 RepID=A0A0F9Q9Z2_9ZZZZ|nr:hypothetical protein [bacterium]